MTRPLRKLYVALFLGALVLVFLWSLRGVLSYQLPNQFSVLDGGLAKTFESHYDKQLPVKEIPFETTLLHRWIEVDKSAGTTILYENDKVVDTYAIALGKPGHDTQEGRFTVYGQLTIQDMGSCDAEGNYVPGGSFDYCTADVPWVTYFNGDQGFHGTYWHSNFGAGAYMSHGCVNMTIAAAERVYYFAQTGTEVWVHA